MSIFFIYHILIYILSFAFVFVFFNGLSNCTFILIRRSIRLLIFPTISIWAILSGLQKKSEKSKHNREISVTKRYLRKVDNGRDFFFKCLCLWLSLSISFQCSSLYECGQHRELKRGSTSFYQIKLLDWFLFVKE